MIQGYGIFSPGETALAYFKRMNPSPEYNTKGDSTFSYSSYNTYFECPLRWFWKYADRRVPREIPNERNTLEGGAMHLLLENLVKERPSDITAWVKANNQRFFDEYLAGLKSCIWKSKNDKDNAYEKYLKLVARGVLFLTTHVFGKEKYLSVIPEQEFVVNVAPGVTINGFIDLSLYNQYGAVEIVDYKGGSSFYVSKEQLMFYGIAGMALYQGPVDQVSFVYPGTNEWKIYRFKDSDYEQLVYKIFTVANKIRENHRVPALNSDACKWCVYKNECEEKPL